MEDLLKKTVSELDPAKQATVGIALANVLLRSQSAMSEYMESEEFEKKYENAPENCDTQIAILNESVDYAIEKMKEDYDSREELKILGEKSQEVRDNLAKGLTIAFKITACHSIFEDYIDEKLGDLPDDTPKEEMITKAKETMGELISKLGGMEELKQPMEQLMELYLRMQDGLF